MNRYLSATIKKDLIRKMVFLAGPRQVGKTTLSQSLPGGKEGYLNWDIDEDRHRILEKKYPNSLLLVLDEVHKYRSWRNYLKGVYDTPGRTRKILVAGSAKLDLYRRSGDSL